MVSLHPQALPPSPPDTSNTDRPTPCQLFNLASRLLSLVERAIGGEPGPDKPATTQDPAPPPKAKVKAKKRKPTSTSPAPGPAAPLNPPRIKRRRSPSREAVAAVLSTPAGRARKDADIAREVGCSHSLVGTVRRELAGDTASDSTDGEPAEKAKPPPVVFSRSPFLAPPGDELPPTHVRKRPGRKPKSPINLESLYEAQSKRRRTQPRRIKPTPADKRKKILRLLATRTNEEIAIAVGCSKRHVASVRTARETGVLKRIANRRGLGRTSNDPTPKEIRERAEFIQRHWRPDEERNRRGLPNEPTADELYTLPILSMPEL